MNQSILIFTIMGLLGVISVMGLALYAQGVEKHGLENLIKIKDSVK